MNFRPKMTSSVASLPRQRATDMTKRPELLSPAGSRAAFDAAIEAGADAIYLGLSTFNARINADNFTPEDIGAAIARAHAYGVKVYVTLNTVVFDREREDFLRTAEAAYLGGADALIVADIGAASLLRRHMPDMPLHASTQFSGHNVAAAEELASLGFSRMVCAREMSEDDLRYFTKNSPIEAEVFVHGALCVCHSGQCLFSSLVGGRSGNRGECAQPCRLPYNAHRGKESYPLSLKDLSLAMHVDKLIDMGVASFKIEGRMKSPEYVRDVTRIWRRLIDENRGATAREMAELAEIFSRGGLTDGYFTKNINSKMLGVRSESDKRTTRELVAFDGIKRRVAVDMEVRIKEGEPSSLTVKPHGVTVLGAVPERAINAPLDKAAVLKNISKLGGTPYDARSIEIELDEGLIMPVSAINALRREAFSSLVKCDRDESDLKPISKIKPKGKQSGERSAVFYEPKNIPDAAKEFFDVIYTPLHLYDCRFDGVMLPPVIFDGEREEIEKMLADASARGARHALVGNIGHIDMVRRAGLVAHADYRMNITSDESAAAVEALGFCDMIVSPELTLPQIRDIGGNRRAVIYGKAVLMTLEKCVIKDICDCEKCEREGFVYLTDRREVRFPVRREWKHRNLVFNAIPIYMADRAEALSKARISGGHFVFSDESRGEIEKIIEAYRKGSAPLGRVRRIN